MKNNIILFAAAFFAAFFCLLCFGDAEIIAAGYEAVYDVTELGANGTDNEDDYHAVQKALNYAKTANGKIKVVIPEGTYYLNRYLYIFSNTDLVLSDKTNIICTDSFNSNAILYGGHVNEAGYICSYSKNCTHTGYSQVENVSITGGSWDRNDIAGKRVSSVISIRHGRNITIADTKVMNCCGHMINLSGVDGAVVRNVKFYDQIAYTGDSEDFWLDYGYGNNLRFRSIEALHLDYCSLGCESSAYPLDDTPAKNVRVTDCTFKNIFSGIGTHHYAPGEGGSNIVIKNNKASNIGATFVFGTDYSGLKIVDNTIKNGSSVCLLWKCTGYISGNYFTGSKNAISETDAVFCTENTNMTIKGNTIKKSNRCSISVSDAAKAVVKNNKIYDCGTVGVYLARNISVSVKDNLIRRGNAEGIYVYDSGKCSISGNQVLGTLQDALRVEGESSYMTSNAYVYNNRLKTSSASAFDLRIGNYVVKCIIKENKMRKNMYYIEPGTDYKIRIATPVLRSAEAVSKGIKLKWNKVSEAYAYKILRKAKNGKWKSVGTSMKSAFTDRTAKKGKTYYYTVKCIDWYGRSISGYDKNGLKVRL